jgi:hypothetical protein
MSDIDDDAQEEFEDRMLDRDKAVSEEHDTTTEALRQGSGLDDRLKEERGAGRRDPWAFQPVGPDAFRSPGPTLFSDLGVRSSRTRRDCGPRFSYRRVT